jgi:hypothetical protein
MAVGGESEEGRGQRVGVHKLSASLPSREYPLQLGAGRSGAVRPLRAMEVNARHVARSVADREPAHARPRGDAGVAALRGRGRLGLG